MVEEPELTALQEHYLGCPSCAGRAEECAAYVDRLRVPSRAWTVWFVVPCSSNANDGPGQNF
jgi:hypothetical protein